MTVFLLYTFKDPALLGRVARRLAPHHVLVHVDAKVDESPFQSAVTDSRERVEFIEDRVVVNWAGWSQLTAIRRLVQRGLAIAGPDEYIVMLSGSDYPLRSMRELDAMLAAHPGRQYLRAFDIYRSASEHYRREIERRHHRDLPLLARHTRHPFARRVRNGAIRTVDLIARLRPPRRLPVGVVPAHGGTHFALTAECLAVLEDSVTPEIERYFSSVFCPEESFYHSLLANGTGDRWGWETVPFAGRGQHQYANLHHIHPSLEKVYTADDWPAVRNMNHFFLRKVQSDVSEPLLDMIDSELLGIDHNSDLRPA